MNPVTLLLGAAALTPGHPAHHPARALLERASGRTVAESVRRIKAAEAKRERRRARRLDLAAGLATLATLRLASTAALAHLRDERHPETPIYVLSEEIVGDLLADLRWTPERISRDPAAAIRAWGGR